MMKVDGWMIVREREEKICRFEIKKFSMGGGIAPSERRQ